MKKYVSLGVYAYIYVYIYVCVYACVFENKTNDYYLKQLIKI